MRVGERQVAPDLSGVRRDHLSRYEFAAKRLPPNSRVVDVACGIGYGSSILADAGHTVLAIDNSEEAIAYGREHYSRPNIEFLCADASSLSLGEFDAAVCFETIEHIENPRPLLLELRKAPVLICSVPNETVFPFRSERNGWRGYAYHFRHYTRREFEGLLNSTGWNVTDWHGQEGPESEVAPNVEGRFLVAEAVRSEIKKAPKSVAIVGLGQSLGEYVGLAKRLGGRSPIADEVWGINALGDVLACDRVFHMDDVLVQEGRAALDPTGNIANMLEWLKKHPGPIYTSIVRDGYPGLVAFPFEDVMNSGGFPYFNNTAAYAIAYAIYIGVETISLFGIDFSLPNMHSAEKGRACCEFWLGIAAARGINIHVPEKTTLMDACVPDDERFYGYDMVDVFLSDRDDGSAEVVMRPRENPPSAEEIERRYDHTRHPNRIVEAENAKNTG